jgi:hypothetical protein
VAGKLFVRGKKSRRCAKKPVNVDHQPTSEALPAPQHLTCPRHGLVAFFVLGDFGAPSTQDFLLWRSWPTEGFRGG